MPVAECVGVEGQVIVTDILRYQLIEIVGEGVNRGGLPTTGVDLFQAVISAAENGIDGLIVKDAIYAVDRVLSVIAVVRAIDQYAACGVFRNLPLIPGCVRSGTELDCVAIKIDVIVIEPKSNDIAVSKIQFAAGVLASQSIQRGSSAAAAAIIG